MYFLFWEAFVYILLFFDPWWSSPGIWDGRTYMYIQVIDTLHWKSFQYGLPLRRLVNLSNVQATTLQGIQGGGGGGGGGGGISWSPFLIRTEILRLIFLSELRLGSIFRAQIFGVEFLWSHVPVTNFNFSLGLKLKYTLRLLGLIFRDLLRFLGPFLTPKWQVLTSLKFDLPPPPRAKKPLAMVCYAGPIFNAKTYRSKASLKIVQGKLPTV